MSIRIGNSGMASKDVIDVKTGVSSSTFKDVDLVKDWYGNIIWQRAIPLTPQNTEITINPTSYSEYGSQNPWSYTKQPTVKGVSVNGVALDSSKYTVSYSENSSGSITGTGSVTAYVRITPKQGSGYSGYVDKNYTISYTYSTISDKYIYAYIRYGTTGNYTGYNSALPSKWTRIPASKVIINGGTSNINLSPSPIEWKKSDSSSLITNANVTPSNLFLIDGFSKPSETSITFQGAEVNNPGSSKLKAYFTYTGAPTTFTIQNFHWNITKKKYEESAPHGSGATLYIDGDTFYKNGRSMNLDTSGDIPSTYKLSYYDLDVPYDTYCTYNISIWTSCTFTGWSLTDMETPNPELGTDKQIKTLHRHLRAYTN